MPERQIITSERFWESLRSELARTHYTSVQRFTDHVLPQVLNEIANHLGLDATTGTRRPTIATHAGAARFETTGWRFWITGIQRRSGSIELDEIDIETWPRPPL